ncbi:SLATT domain-containing protein [Agromyces sp. NPDC056523]|uniref:SLATT domain-containing protein n=1 Tax=Agromyces sp. NPDC056523 TaxID=3345850 RepID=UPI00366A99F9
MPQDALIESTRELFGRVVYTHKTHEKERERLSRLGTLSRWTNIILNALTLGGVVSIFNTGSQEALIATALLATLSAAYALIQLSFDPVGAAASHRAAAKRLLGIRDELQLLLSDLSDNAVDPDSARARRNRLADDAQYAYELAPDTSPRSYRAASKALQVDEDMTFSDEELNHFLPKALHWPKSVE